MVTDDKIKEVRKRVRAGIPEGEIKEELSKTGYSDADIAKIFAPHHYDMRSWYLFFGLTLLLAGIWLYLNRGSLLVLILSILIFMQYYREVKRLKKIKKSNGDITEK